MKVWPTETNQETSIPYTPKEKAGTHQNYGYFDVKRHPELLNRIPELRTSRELRNFVRMMNSPETVFRTIGCDYGDRASDSPQYTFMYLSFVTIVFDILEWNLQKSNFTGLYTQFEQFAGSKGDLPSHLAANSPSGLHFSRSTTSPDFTCTSLPPHTVIREKKR